MKVLMISTDYYSGKECIALLTIFLAGLSTWSYHISPLSNLRTNQSKIMDSDILSSEKGMALHII